MVSGYGISYSDLKKKLSPQYRVITVQRYKKLSFCTFFMNQTENQSQRFDNYRYPETSVFHKTIKNIFISVTNEHYPNSQLRINYKNMTTVYALDIIFMRGVLLIGLCLAFD